MKHLRWWMLAGLAALVLAGAFAGAMKALFGAREREWTSRSKAALQELEKGVRADARGYAREALKHYDRALELDQKFVAARVLLTGIYPRSSAQFKELIAEIEQADVSRLNPRERFLVRHRLAERAGRHAEVKAMLDDYLSEYPDDLFALDLRCQSLWDQQDWEQAESCYYRVVEIYPNQVEAYNRLGKIDMAQGHFTEAEEHFRSHCFIAPDQTLPLTPLAELLILLGRYEEAEKTLFKVLEIDDGYCWAHIQLIRTYYLSSRFEKAEAIIDRLPTEPGCADFGIEKGSFLCNVRGLVDFLRGDFEKSWSRFDGECLAKLGGFDLFGHHAALLTGRTSEAARMSERLRRRIEEVRAGEDLRQLDWFEPLYAHFQGVQHLAAGNYARASAGLREADERLRYWTGGESGFKLMNRIFLAHSLELEGKTGRSRALFAKVDAVNPRFAEHLPEMSFLKER